MQEIHFQDIVAPLTPEAFFREYWERKPLVTRGRARDFFAPLFSTRDVDRFILYTRPGPGRLDLVTEGGFVRDNFLGPDQTANINLVYESYLKGSTLILSGLDETWEPLALFTRRLEAQLSHPTAIAVYLTPPKHHGVQPHFDTQENFILQVEGVKHWKVYEPARELPPVEGSYLPVPRERLSKPLLEAELRPGDMLYLPRGFVHEAAAGEEASLHITVDVHVRTWHDFLLDALAPLAERQPHLRKSLPPGFLGDERARAALEGGFRELVDMLQREARLSDAVDRHAERLIVSRPPLPDGHFSMLHADIGLHTPLRKRASARTRLVQQGEVAGIQFSGNHLLGPRKIAEALRYISETEVVVPADLPGGLTDNEKVLLSRRLVRTGLLTR